MEAEEARIISGCGKGAASILICRGEGRIYFGKIVLTSAGPLRQTQQKPGGRPRNSQGLSTWGNADHICSHQLIQGTPLGSPPSLLLLHTHINKNSVSSPEICSWGCPGPTTSHIPASLPLVQTPQLVTLSHGWDSLHWRAAPHREKKAISPHNKGTGLPAAAAGNVTPISGSSGLQTVPFQTGRNTHTKSCPWCCSFLPITPRGAGAVRV